MLKIEGGEKEVAYLGGEQAIKAYWIGKHAILVVPPYNHDMIM